MSRLLNNLPAWAYALLAAGFLAAACVEPASATTGSVAYTYDALNRIIQATYDDGTIIQYSYDANGNVSQQVIPITKPLCFGTSAHGNPTIWGTGLWSNAGPGC